MSRIGTFFFGALFGAAVCFTALKYHVLRTNDGFQLVPKLTANFSETYVDVRNFKPDDWNRHKGLVAAIVHSGKTNMLGDSAVGSLRDQAEDLLGQLGVRGVN
jgi:hypothetical protein